MEVTPGRERVTCVQDTWPCCAEHHVNCVPCKMPYAKLPCYWMKCSVRTGDIISVGVSCCDGRGHLQSVLEPRELKSRERERLRERERELEREST